MESNETTTSTQQSGGYKKIQPRWKAGESGNPLGGSRRLPNIEKTIRKEIYRRNAAGDSPLEVVVTNLFNNALKGDTGACIKILDLTYGKTN